ncbi:MAG: phosphoglucomutase/phosphomannomutase family protein, partial [Candidatus Bipolaricaulota bacterium]|nr:phosphoglucomutase/phosphomannomutase family protein [Candidatus Bipolaricaulota bacterium]
RWGVPCRPPERGVVIGYDTRFLSREFAIHLGRVLQDAEIPVWIAQEAVPTPALSFAVQTHQAALGVMVTASHNPPEYNGVKVKVEYASSAPPSGTRLIEQLIPAEAPTVKSPESALNFADLKSPYLQRLRELIDRKTLEASPLVVVVDAMYGAGRGYIAQILKDLGVESLTVRHGDNPRFGGKNPEPIEKNLSPLRAVIASERQKRARSAKFLMGVVTDGDADRVAAMDELGHLIDSHRCFALILKHLLLARRWRGKVVKSFTLSDMAEVLAVKHDLALEEVPVGFKHICEKMVREDVLIGGEESGGFAIKHHIPERDGILNALLLCEIAARAQRPMSEIVDDLLAEVGPHWYDRRDLHLENRLEIVERVKQRPPREIAGLEVMKTEMLDGVKLRFARGWLLLRASGTEPLLRLYCEADSPTRVREVLDEAERFARGDLGLWGR